MPDNWIMDYSTDSLTTISGSIQPILKALESSGVSLSSFSKLLSTSPESWTLDMAHLGYQIATVTFLDAVEGLGFDPDLIPTPPKRILDIKYPSFTLSALDVDPKLIEYAKTIPGCFWIGGLNRWEITVIPAALNSLRLLLKDYDVKVSHEASSALKQIGVDAKDKLGAYSIGKIYIGNAGRVYTQLYVPNALIADDLKRVSGLRWDGTSNAYIAPATRLKELLAVSSKYDFYLDPTVAKSLNNLDAPLIYDGTLDGLRGVPITDLHCVDAKKAEKFKEFGIESVLDLLLHIPIRYLDRSNLTAIRSLEEGQEVGLLAKITDIYVDQRRRLLRITVSDGTGKIPLTYFNAVWQAKRFRVGDEVSIYGKVDSWTGSTRKLLSITNPVMDPVGDSTLPVIPIYSQSAKTRITTWEIHQAIQEAVRRLGELTDPLPQSIREELTLMDRSVALKEIHLPINAIEADRARSRLAFDELFRMQAGLLLSKNMEEAEEGIVHHPTGELSGALISSLPFPLTGAQQRANKEIKENLTRPHPMHRLLQGDVGSGKSLISFATLLSGLESGYQGALMAPTEILSSQLFNELVERTEGILYNGRPIKVEFFSNKLKGKKRIEALRQLAEGEIDIAVGTHALIVGDIEFKNLGVVVIDEQHRFGVEQRARLRDKGPKKIKDGVEIHVRPDMLVMTATPIPRTAALAVFGDLDISILDELPPGRTPIVTSWIDSVPNLLDASAEPWASIREQVALGRQAYVVCPLVEESEKLEVASAVETYESLSFGALVGLRLGLVHGQQKSEERTEIMKAFKAGELDVLVATTVIEVGVNVPNATIITILDANRFGIAQLHQLRGRVGRGSHASSCILYGRCVSSDARIRMQALCDSTDGFYLSEVDLNLRGHGSVFGASQSGISDLRVADLERDRELLFAARQVAEDVLRDDPKLARRPALRGEIGAVLGEVAVEWLRRS
jgi:ATP-dependent DNA helicase RecG